MNAMIDALYKKLALPESCYLGKKIFKKHFYEMDMNATDKNAFSQDIDKITWRYTLKPETITIAKYEDEEREYLEVAVIDVVLKSAKRCKRIAEVIQRAIPYPVLLIVVCGEEISLNVAPKRVSLVDNIKIIVEALHDTGWLSPETSEGVKADFLADFCVTNFSYHNYFDFYQDMVQRVIALNCAVHTGQYLVTKKGIKTEEKVVPYHTSKEIDGRLERLQELERLQQERLDICSKAKNEKNMGTQVQLNTKVRQLSDRIEAIRSEL